MRASFSETMAFGCCLGALFFVVTGGCSGPPPKEPDIIETATAVKVHAEYKTLLARCRNLAKTYEVYDACADAVDANFCMHHGLRCVDAGAP